MAAKLTKEVIIKIISERHRSGEKLSSDYTRRNHLRDYDAGMRLFGSWQKAVEAAGIDYLGKVKIKPNSTRTIWSPEKIIGEIRFVDYCATNLSDAYIKANHRPLYSASRRVFGTWKAAVQAAGCDYESSAHPIVVRKRRQYIWTPETVRDEILRRQSEKLLLTATVVSAEDRGLYKAANRVFGAGGWAKALTYAGVEFNPPIPQPEWDREKVIAGIQELRKKGEPLNHAYMTRHHRPLFSAGRDLFKGWRKAVRAAGVKYREVRASSKPHGWWSAGRILGRIKVLEKHGVRLSYKYIMKRYPGMVEAARRRYGSWSEAVETAGISYQRHCRIWSTKAWLRRMGQVEYEATIESAQLHARNRRRSRRQ